MGYRYQCSEDVFQVTSENRDELVDMVQQHARNSHEMNLERGDIEDGMEEV